MTSYMTSDPIIKEIRDNLQKFQTIFDQVNIDNSPFQLLHKIFKYHPDVNSNDLAEMLNFELKLKYFDWYKIIDEYFYIERLFGDETHELIADYWENKGGIDISKIKTEQTVKYMKPHGEE